MSTRRLPTPTRCPFCGSGPYSTEQSYRHHLGFRHARELGDRDRSILTASVLFPWSVPTEAVRQIVERTSA